MLLKNYLAVALPLVVALPAEDTTKSASAESGATAEMGFSRCWEYDCCGDYFSNPWVGPYSCYDPFWGNYYGAGYWGYCRHCQYAGFC